MNPNNPATILIVDDEKGIRELVKTFLLRYHYHVVEADSAKALFSQLQTIKPNLILLDLMLPDMFGLEVCKIIRQTSQVPIVMLTAMEGEVNTVLGFEAGADDYIQKPFSAQVLLSRIQAILRRANLTDEAAPLDAKTSHYQKALFGQWAYFPIVKELQHLNGRVISLTKQECALLELFIAHPENVLSREKIAQLLNMDIDEVVSRAIDVQVSRLRLKLKDKTQSNFIKSIRHKGYLFSMPIRIVE